MRQRVLLLGVATLLCACANNKGDITIDEQNAMSIAYDQSYELSQNIVEATTYEEFKAARAALNDYEAAFRTQIGGEEYQIFLEECNMMLNEL